MNILEAAKSGLYSEVERCLKEGQPTHVVDFSGFTPLHWAAANGHTFVAELLLKHGADVNIKGSRLDIVPLHVAALNNHPEMIDLLLQYHADRDALNSNEANALDIALSLEDNFEAVMALVKNGASIKEEHLINLKEMFCNSLMVDHVEFVQFMVEQGYTLREFLSGQESIIMGYHLPLVVAAANGSIKTLEYILTQDPSAIKFPGLCMGKLFGMSMLSFVKLYMPPKAYIEGNLTFFANQKGVHITKPEELKALFPEEILDAIVSVEYDAKNRRFYFDKLMYGMVQLDFNPDGSIKNVETLLDNLKKCIQLLQEKGQAINAQDGLLSGSTTTSSLLNCPALIIQCFVDCGLTFTGKELQEAIQTASSEVVRVVIESGADILWKNEEGKNAIQLIMNVDNDQILNARPDLIRLMEDKANIPNKDRIFPVKEQPMLQMYRGFMAKENLDAMDIENSEIMDIAQAPLGSSRRHHFAFQ